jgi:farnesyl-diphosphate farnesyltransferase
MAGGMASYSKRWQGLNHLTVLEDQDDLEQYCYFVAGTVGNMLTRVFLTVRADLDQEVIDGLRKRSVSFGLGLQLTNIVKDVATDHERGWCFLPATFCARHGVDPDRLLDPDCRDAAMRVVSDVVDLARKRLDDALEYTLLLPDDAVEVRLFVLVPLVLAQASLTLVQRCPAVLVPDESVKISKAFVADVLAQARDVVGDNEGIKALCVQAATLKL